MNAVKTEIMNAKVRNAADRATARAMSSTNADDWTYESLYRQGLKSGQSPDPNELRVFQDMDREAAHSRLANQQAKEWEKRLRGRKKSSA